MEALIYLLIAFVFFWIFLFTGQKAFMAAQVINRWDRTDTYIYVMIITGVALVWPVTVTLTILIIVIRYLSKISGLLDYLENRGKEIALEKENKEIALEEEGKRPRVGW